MKIDSLTEPFTVLDARLEIGEYITGGARDSSKNEVLNKLQSSLNGRSEKDFLKAEEMSHMATLLNKKKAAA